MASKADMPLVQMHSLHVVIEGDQASVIGIECRYDASGITMMRTVPTSPGLA